MARTGRFVSRFLLVCALCGGAYLAWVSSFGTPSPVELLPPGAFCVVDVRGAEGLADRLSGTRFAAAFAQSATREWLERTAAVRAFDSVLAEVRRISGVSPGRSSVFDLIGAEAAVGWYPAAGGESAGALWVAGGRLSLRAWAVASAMRLGRMLGLGATSVTREETAGCVLYSVPGSAGKSLYLFLAGRVLVGGSDRSLVVAAARAVGDAGASVTREPAWQAIQGALPASGELYVWVRDRSVIPGVVPAGPSGRGSAGARLRAGKTIEIDVAAEPSSSRPAVNAAGGAPKPLPGIALLRQAPLFLLTSGEPAPTALTDLLQTRLRAVAKRSRSTATQQAAIRPGSGYAVVITDSVVGPGFFPTPRGVVVIGMADAAEAASALPLLFPPGARSATSGGTRALATRESFPLAGEFEFWGAAVGPQLVFATDTSLIDAAVADPGTVATPRPEDQTWTASSVATISMEKLLPLLRRWGPPLSGLVAASWPDGPDVTRDLGLLAAVGTIQVTAGSDSRFARAAITLNLHDLQ